MIASAYPAALRYRVSRLSNPADDHATFYGIPPICLVDRDRYHAEAIGPQSQDAGHQIHKLFSFCCNIIAVALMETIMQAKTANGWVPRGAPLGQEEIARRVEEANVKFQRGVRAHNCGDFKEAIESYASASRYDPNHADAFHNLGVALMAVQKFTQAIEALDNAVQLRPTQVESIVLLGQALLEDKRNDDAAKLMEKSNQLLPGNEEILALNRKVIQTLEKTSPKVLQR